MEVKNSNISELHALNTWNLHDFVTENAVTFFARFDTSADFLVKDSSEWASDPEYSNAKKMLATLKVVNDIAERGVTLMQDFNKSFTKNDEMLCALFSAHHRTIS